MGWKIRLTQEFFSCKFFFPVKKTVHDTYRAGLVFHGCCKKLFFSKSSKTPKKSHGRPS